jgi:dTDP-4-dehydrorhamnose 3,5-epimerase
MEITELGIKGVKVLIPRYFEDYRGYYSETYSSRTMAEVGIDTVFVQDNHSFSHTKGTLRGIHFQNNPEPQLKLVRCTRGKMVDYAVDLRKDSPTFKQHVKVELSEDNHKQILIPPGFGHAFLTLTDNVEVLYKVDAWYSPTLDRAITYSDPDIGIDWKFAKYGIDKPIISHKDIDAPTLKDSDVNFIMEANPT